VVLLAAGEPPHYGVESASRRLSLADDAQDVPPVLLRPFYLRDLRSKYASIGRSPYREYYIELSRKVQSRLDSNHKVYIAFYNDNPTLPQVLAQAIGEGARHITLVHTRTTDPADAVKAGELLEGIDPESYGVSMSEIGPLFQSDLLPQIYVRRVLEAVPLVSSDLSKIGVLLVGRGHALSANRNTASVVRYNQENDFQERLRNALLKVGFSDERVVVSWLRWSPPTPAEGLGKLAAAGCKIVLWMPSTFAVDGTVTLYDIPSELDPAAKEAGISLVPLSAWNADDLAAEDIAARVRAATPRLPGAAAAQSLR
jgi:protoheme ferro-lyase